MQSEILKQLYFLNRRNYTTAMHGMDDMPSNYEFIVNLYIMKIRFENELAASVI